MLDVLEGTHIHRNGTLIGKLDLKEGQQSDRMTIIESIPFSNLKEVTPGPSEIKIQERLEESGNKKRILMVLEGVFQRADTRNNNGRIYPDKIWERILTSGSKYMRRISDGQMLGEADHPQDGQTLLSRVAAMTTDIRRNENNPKEIMGRMVIFDTTKGRDLKAIHDGGGRIGVSSRGNGSVVRLEGNDVVQEDYDLDTWDVVHNPSTPGAYPSEVKESVAPINEVHLVKVLFHTGHHGVFDASGVVNKTDPVHVKRYGKHIATDFKGKDGQRAWHLNPRFSHRPDWEKASPEEHQKYNDLPLLPHEFEESEFLPPANIQEDKAKKIKKHFVGWLPTTTSKTGYTRFFDKSDDAERFHFRIRSSRPHRLVRGQGEEGEITGILGKRWKADISTHNPEEGAYEATVTNGSSPRPSTLPEARSAVVNLSTGEGKEIHEIVKTLSTQYREAYSVSGPLQDYESEAIRERVKFELKMRGIQTISSSLKEATEKSKKAEESATARQAEITEMSARLDAAKKIIGALAAKVRMSEAEIALANISLREARENYESAVSLLSGMVDHKKESPKKIQESTSIPIAESRANDTLLERAMDMSEKSHRDQELRISRKGGFHGQSRDPKVEATKRVVEALRKRGFTRPPKI